MTFKQNQIVYRKKGLLKVPRIVQINKSGTYNTICLNTGLACLLGVDHKTMVEYYGENEDESGTLITFK